MSKILRRWGWAESTVLFIFIGLLFYLSLPVESEKNLDVDPPSSADIIAQLRQKKYDVTFMDRGIVALTGDPIPGHVYLGRKRLHRLDLFAKLASKRTHYKSITLIPGETTPFFLDLLARTMDYNRTKLSEAYARISSYPEAGILAETYHVPLHLDETDAIRFLISLSNKRYKRLAKAHQLAWDTAKWQRILTVASIIQKEAANTREMPIVASVVYNRLHRKMRLQMDGTLNYGRYSHTPVTPERIRTDRTTFNTYKHKGLPDSPVCNVSIDAIEAALHPAKTNYLYFMKNDHGTHDFSQTYKAHLKNVHERKLNTKD
jgi:UPF0755 protein